MSQSNRYERRRLKKKARDEKRLRRAIEFPKKVRRNKSTNKHHIKNSMHNGPTRRENLLTIDIDKHNMIHRIFHNLDFYDIILVLIRTCRMKHYEVINPNIERFYKLLDE